MLSLLRPIAGQLSPGGRRARLSVLIYHRVRPRPDPLRPREIDAATFRWQMRLLARQFRPLPLGEAAERLARGDLPPRAVCVTFDDGYADNLTEAAPILADCGVPATFFIATGFLDGGRMWNDTIIETVRRLPAGPLDLSAFGLERDTPVPGPEGERVDLSKRLIDAIKYLEPAERQVRVEALARLAGAPLPDDLMLSSAQLRELAALPGVDIGGHTVHHPILARLSPDQARQEIGQGKQRLEALLNREINCFAYPNGKPDTDYRDEHVAMARDCGFATAVSTRWGVSTSETDRWQLRRFTPWDRTPARFMTRLLLNLRQH